jgi:hypothetical protein
MRAICYRPWTRSVASPKCRKFRYGPKSASSTATSRARGEYRAARYWQRAADSVIRIAPSNSAGTVPSGLTSRKDRARAGRHDRDQRRHDAQCLHTGARRVGSQRGRESRRRIVHDCSQTGGDGDVGTNSRKIGSPHWTISATGSSARHESRLTSLASPARNAPILRPWFFWMKGDSHARQR